MAKKNIITKIEPEKFVTSIRDWNGIKIALYKTKDGGSQVINKNSEGEWVFSESISIYDVIKSPPWIEDE